MSTLIAFLLTASAALAGSETVPGLTGTDIPIELVAPNVTVRVSCKPTDTAIAELTPEASASLTLAKELITEPKPGARFTVSGTGTGELKVAIPKHVRLKISGVSRKLMVVGCDGNVIAKGAIPEFIVDTPGAKVDLTVKMGGVTKPSEVKQAVDISVNMPDIAAKITGTGISVNMPDIAPGTGTGASPVTLTHTYGTATPAPPTMNLTASQTVTVIRK